MFVTPAIQSCARHCRSNILINYSDLYEESAESKVSVRISLIL
jgi:hypothetical protein